MQTVVPAMYSEGVQVDKPVTMTVEQKVSFLPNTQITYALPPFEGDRR